MVGSSELETPRVISWDEHKEHIIDLRSRAWVSNSQFLLNEMYDEFDEIAIHWAVFAEGVVVGAIRLSIHSQIESVPYKEVYLGYPSSTFPSPIGSYNRLVVAPEYRRRGIGQALDRVCIDYCRSNRVACLIGATGSVQENKHRIETMARLGFEVVGLGDWPTNSPILHENRPIIMCLRFQNFGAE